MRKSCCCYALALLARGCAPCRLLVGLCHRTSRTSGPNELTERRGPARGRVVAGHEDWAWPSKGTASSQLNNKYLSIDKSGWVFGGGTFLHESNTGPCEIHKGAGPTVDSRYRSPRPPYIFQRPRLSIRNSANSFEQLPGSNVTARFWTYPSKTGVSNRYSINYCMITIINFQFLK